MRNTNRRLELEVDEINKIQKRVWIYIADERREDT